MDEVPKLKVVDWVDCCVRAEGVGVVYGDSSSRNATFNRSTVTCVFPSELLIIGVTQKGRTVNP